jgi:hypothetical protein
MLIAVALMSYFSRNFGFTANETVAIMGAHNMGAAATTNSGFQVYKAEDNFNLYLMERPDT